MGEKWEKSEKRKPARIRHECEREGQRKRKRETDGGGNVKRGRVVPSSIHLPIPSKIGYFLNHVKSYSLAHIS